MPILTPNTFRFVRDNTLPELEPRRIQDVDLKKRAKYMQICKDAVWKRWTAEYLRGLREQHRQTHKKQNGHPEKGDAVIISSREKNRGK